MFSKSLALAIAAASSLVSAQTSTACNPLKTTCPADPAFGSKKVVWNFANGACSSLKALGSTSQITYGNNGAQFSITQQGQAPTIATSQYLFFGRVDVQVQAAPGRGIVTAFVLQSDDLDEIDLEWVGADNSQVQSNYFSRGDTSSYDRGAFHPVSNPTGSTHTYSIEWTSKYVKWIIDTQTVRTLTYEQAMAKGGAAGFPQTPMQVKLGTWIAGRPDASPGTVQWAGGYVDWSQAPFNAYFRSINITDYAGADSYGKDAKQYVYGDHSGTYQSIKVQ
ncbi:Licheninase [Purpureocillium takamizusanense]|uniref:Licheninase n=1 Tax=Purpureocillium takamizusanense TaxID=2060973 RepID=A0A9Q8Q505_9HYPO|nr:Licheninase [Purpureocillium takamizusanense]UNI13793.1 Licheninase [Purpureocillium takamizusanense]